MILERRADHVLLIVEDDGVGFDPRRPEAPVRDSDCRHAGARGLVGATLEIESAAGKGTTILVRMAAGAGPAARPDHD